MTSDNINCLTNEEYDSVVQSAKKYFNIDDSTFSIFKYSIKYPAELLGWLGEHKYCNVIINHHGQYKTMSLFIKSLPADKMKAKEIVNYQFYERECCVYTNIFPRFKKREENDIFLPNILHIRKNEQLFFEDMSVKGYRITNHRESLDDEHCLLTLTQIGKMHADVLTLEENETQKSNSIFRIKDQYKNVLDSYEYDYEGWYYIGSLAGLEAAKISSKMPKNINIELFTEKWHEFFKKAMKMFKSSDTIRNILCHRDLWSNNIMYRYDEDGKPVQCLIIDFQTCGVMVPAGDIMSFIYLNVNDERRHVNLEKYLKHYYQSLETELKQNELKVENLVPWNEFRECCEEYKVYALAQCIILLQICLIDGKEAKNIFKDTERYDHYMFVSRSELILDLIKNDKIFRDLFMFSVDEIVQHCI